MLKRWIALILAALLLMSAFAVAETEESVLKVDSLIEDGSFIVQIPATSGENGWVADDMSQDDSIVKLYDADTIEDTFVARYDPVGDGDVTVCVKHMNSLACDMALTWDLRVKDGEVQEVLGGSQTQSPDEMEQDPYISGEWQINDNIMAGMTITKNDGQGWALQIATAYPGVYVFQADMAYDCELDQFVYSNATVYQSEITNSPEIVLGDVVETGASGTLSFVEVNGSPRLEWYNALSPEETALFYRPDGWEEEDGMAEGADSDWYMVILADPELSAQFPYHSFLDVNGDGVPVLIVSTTEESFIGDEDRANVYVYSAGEPKKVMEAGGNAGEKFFCNADEHTLTYYWRLSGEEHIEVYSAKDGELTLITKLDRYAQNHGPKGGDDETWFQDEQEIDAEAGETLFTRYADEGDVVTYEAMAELANPWVDMDEDELWQTAGVNLNLPEGAEATAFRWLESEGLAEMQFTLDGDEYCARVKPAALEAGELENISGIYYGWEHEEEIKVAHCPGTLGLAQTGSEDFVEMCMWYDLVPGLMYSLSVNTTDPDGLDLTAVAEMVYEPMQGDS